MRKLSLDVDAIVVETFHTVAASLRAGTVHGAWYDAVRGDSGDSECEICWSADPCTNIPIASCTCGCDPTVPITPGTVPQPAITGCAATSECTCTPIETCSCAPAYG